MAVDLTHEDLEPGLLFQKFLDDGATVMCTEVVRKDIATGAGVLLVHVDEHATWESDEAAIRKNMSRALLRFHGRYLEPDHPQLEPWTWLYRSTAEMTDSRSAWRTVCVGLLTHPDFYSY